MARVVVASNREWPGGPEQGDFQAGAQIWQTFDFKDASVEGIHLALLFDLVLNVHKWGKTTPSHATTA